MLLAVNQNKSIITTTCAWWSSQFSTHLVAHFSKVRSVFSQFPNGNAVKDCVRSFTNNKLEYAHQSFLIYIITWFMAESFCVGQALCKSVPTTPYDTLIPHMLGIEPKSKCFVIFLGAEVMLISFFLGPTWATLPFLKARWA